MPKRTSKYHPFETARNLVREEYIPSIAAYQRWYQHNKPTKIPKRPDIIYKRKGWVSWNDYLGNNNKFKHTKKNFCSYEEARRWARTLKLNTYAEWLAHVKGGNKPDNIPARPDYYYKDWFTWKDFLGTGITEVVKEAVKARPVLYVIKVGGTPANVFKVNVTYGGKDALVEAKKKGARIMAAFEYLSDLDWRVILEQYGNNYWHGESDDYAFSNVNGFIFELSSQLDMVKF